MSSSAWPEAEPPVRRPPRWGAALASVAIGVGGALLGLLPWIATGMRLPLQNLWALDALPEDMPVAWLPFSQYSVTFLLAVLVVGAAAAGIATRVLRRRLPSAAPVTVAAGLLFVQVVAAAQAVEVLRAGLQTGDEAAFYLAACIGVAVFGMVGGLLGFAAVARGGVPVAVVALTLAAISVGWWISGYLALLGPLSPLPYALAPLATWIPPVLAGAAIAWGGVRTRGRIVAAAVGLVLLWVVPALATAVQSAVGSRVLLRSPGDLLDYGWSVFVSALTMPQLVLPRLAVAVVVAAVGFAGVAVVSRRVAQRVSSG
ncbi:hypothetical protein [Protaetiibacter intestinalis]|uniref:Uncharacterized protein n=1 Tax=Protaetiibacter intestinalis TaxID=2419774 RepID=A0A387B6K9_9MICO|nr:hypothetical protein [Protaetiibacter intestinalis]AYF97983.1 hypothetical protein D7I47_06740 [Protaetiibacter intestinalis]